MIKNAVKTGYVKLITIKTRKADYFHYEDLFFRETLRYQLRKKSEHGCYLCCACVSDNSAKLHIDKNDMLVIEEPEKHSKKCREYLIDISQRMRSEAVSGYMKSNGKLNVSFNWTDKSRPSSDAISISDADITRKKQLDFSSWIAASNLLTFINRTESASMIKGAAEQADDVRFIMGTHICFNPKIKDSSEILFSSDKFYSSQGVGYYGLYYGKIVSVPKRDAEGSKVNMYIRAISIDGRPIGFRVKSKEFLHLYEYLPDKDNAWICGFIKVRELEYDNSKGNVSYKKAGAPIPNRLFVKDTYKAVVKEMRYFRLFSCNNAGMIVFNNNELRLSNEALEKGLKLYRPLVCNPAVNPGIMIFNKDGEDKSLL